MATFSVRIMKNGEPLEGAEVIVGELLYAEATAADGIVTADLERTTPAAVQVTVNGSGFAFGGGPFTLRPNVELVIEV